MEDKRLIEKILFGFMAVCAAVIAYAMDWQRDQDEQLAGFRALVAEQKILLQLQQEYQRNQLPPAAVTQERTPFVETPFSLGTIHGEVPKAED